MSTQVINQSSNQIFYNRQDVAGGIMFHHNNATIEDFNNKCVELDIHNLTWRCFGNNCIFFYKRHTEEEEDKDYDSDYDEEEE